MRIPSSREEARAGARSLAWARVALGVAAFALPRLPATPWIGKDASRPSSRLLSRALGARDVALGLGALVSKTRSADTRLAKRVTKLAKTNRSLAKRLSRLERTVRKLSTGH